MAASPGVPGPGSRSMTGAGRDVALAVPARGSIWWTGLRRPAQPTRKCTLGKSRPSRPASRNGHLLPFQAFWTRSFTSARWHEIPHMNGHLPSAESDLRHASAAQQSCRTVTSCENCCPCYKIQDHSRSGRRASLRTESECRSSAAGPRAPSDTVMKYNTTMPSSSTGPRQRCDTDVEHPVSAPKQRGRAGDHVRAGRRRRRRRRRLFGDSGALASRQIAHGG